MLLSSKQEFLSFFPTAAIDDPKTLMSLINRAEDIHVVPILGQSLYLYVNNAYSQILKEFSGVSPEMIPEENVDDAIRLIRLCQSVAVMFAIADNIGVMSVSLNLGGGLSVVETDGYSAADDKVKDRLHKDLFRNAMADVERLLSFLEKDAKSSSPLFADMWRESGYFYSQGDLLIPNATEAKRYARKDIQPFERNDYINMTADLRFSQMTFVSPELGEDLLNAFLSLQTSDQPIADVHKFLSENTTKTISFDTILYVWNKTLFFLRTALFNHARFSQTQKSNYENDAKLAMARAKEIINDEIDLFKPFALKSPFCKNNNENHDKNKPSVKPFDKDDALFAPFL